MNLSDYVNIAFALISIILFFISLYSGGKNKVVSSIAGLIYEAEQTYGAGTGPTKLSYVVGKLYALIPAAVRPFLPESLLQTAVQAVFDKVQAFGLLQIKQLAGKDTAATEAPAK